MQQKELNDDFYRELFRQQQTRDAVPSNKEITKLAERIICVLFSHLSTCVPCSEQAVKDVFREPRAERINILNTTTACQDCDDEETARKFFDQVPEI